MTLLRGGKKKSHENAVTIYFRTTSKVACPFERTQGKSPATKGKLEQSFDCGLRVGEAER